MGHERLERRLSAILAADVAGYSRLMGVDEEGTHVQLKGHLRTLVEPKIAEHRGRVVKNTGDGMLVEFSSVVDALRCAVEVQRGPRAMPKCFRINGLSFAWASTWATLSLKKMTFMAMA